MDCIGFLQLHRELMEKPIWTGSTPEQKVVLITLLMMANFKEKQWEWEGKKFVAKPGQFVTSLDKIVEKCGKGITTQNVRSSLVRFEKLEFLTNESTKTGRLVTIVNWHLYQSKKETQHSNQQRPNKDPTPIEEGNKGKIKNTVQVDEFFEYCWSMYPSKKGKGQISYKKKEEAHKLGEEFKMAIETYKRYLKQNPWLHCQNGSTFWNSGYVDYIGQRESKTSDGTTKPNIIIQEVYYNPFGGGDN